MDYPNLSNSMCSINRVLEEVYYLNNVDEVFRIGFERVLRVINYPKNPLVTIQTNQYDRASKTRYMASTTDRAEEAKVAVCFAYIVQSIYNGDFLNVWAAGVDTLTNQIEIHSRFTMNSIAGVYPNTDKFIKKLINDHASHYDDIEDFDAYQKMLDKAEVTFKKYLADYKNSNLITRWAHTDNIKMAETDLKKIEAIRLSLVDRAETIKDLWNRYHEFIASETISQFDYQTTLPLIKEHQKISTELYNSSSFIFDNATALNRKYYE